ncbi:AraC family transcriptional regulator [Bowmanella yangjiangensis]|uniref:AraC family transcriptional regulator n=1 Tax=Bowmanella yangjiangensis TaxID=2811230 RepID=A0ABS3CUJ4_9ALTE|nr:AraC family transcriptional regulator [Bowmanella yangjiangensis]MBN7820792.1 AraC family transcriptional regulator [Bowmanella yangjiangensis]
MPNLQVVCEYIDCHLSQELRLEELCRLAYQSPFHFHRLFSAQMGLGLSAYIRQARLKRATWQLAFRPQMSITCIALDNGYQSLEGFSRAFRLVSGLSPSAFRQNPDWHWWHHYPQKETIMTSTSDFQVQLVQRTTTPVALLVHQGAPHLLGQSIQRFIAWRKANQLPPAKSATFNLLYDDPSETPPEDYRFGLACEYRGPASDEIDVTELPAGTYARLSVKGGDQQLEEAIRYLYGHWLPEQARQAGNYPLFLQRLSFYPDVPVSQAQTDIYLLLKSNGSDPSVQSEILHVSS